jgi:radical SAM superfamily enzyme YgiQ (UPF0313 family)
MGLRIHLVTPKNPPSFWTYDPILPTLGKQCLCPNLSMPTVAGLTPGDHEVTLCDENVEEIDFDVDADIVGVTGYIVHKKRMLEILDEFRRRGQFVVVGGPFASLCPEALRGRADVLFVGEAEETWSGFLQDFEAGSCKSEYRAPRLPDLTHPSVPRFDLMQVDRYFVMAIQFARGCPFQCEFCDIIVMYGRQPRTKPVDHMLREIEECYRLGARQIFIVDDNFIGNRKNAKALLREIARWQREHGYPLYFNTEVSLNVAQDDELLELLRDARFGSIFVGIETPRTASLEETGKVQNTRGDLVESVKKIQSYGIQVQAGMIVGFDNDDPSIFEEQLRFIEEARISVSMTGMLQAIPKTPLHARLATEGRLVDESTGDQFVFSNILPKQMSRVELYRGYRDLISALYSFRSFRDRTLAFLLERGRVEGIRTRIRAADLRVLYRALRDTIFRAKPRRALFTLALLGRTLLRKPSAFPEAVSFAVIHKGLADYVETLTKHLDRVIATLQKEAMGGLSGSPAWESEGRRLASGSEAITP